MDNIIEENQLIDNSEAWEGNNYFPCKGKLLYGPSGFRPTLITATSILIPVCLFIGADSKYMKDRLNISIPIIIGVLTVITIAFLIVAAFSDPGMILRRPLKGQIELCRRPLLINQAGHLRTYRYCGTCSIMRPNRSTHCGDCNNCVERFDHHCPWIGNCAGRRNYVYFYTFLVLLNILTVFMGVFCIVHIALYVDETTKEGIDNVNKAARSLGECIISLFVLIYCALSMLFTTGLLIYHTKLISHNITTKEELKKFFANPYGNPFERNLCLNWRSVLCPKLRKRSILDYFKTCKINKNIIVTEEKKSLKDINNKDIGLGDERSLNNELNSHQIENKYTLTPDNKMNNGRINNSDQTNIVDKKNEEYFNKESNKSQVEIQTDNNEKVNVTERSEKYSNVSEVSSVGNAKKVMPSLICNIDLKNPNEIREVNSNTNAYYNSNNQGTHSSPDSNSRNGEEVPIKRIKNLTNGSHSSVE